MIRKYLLPVLAVCGMAFAVYMVLHGNKPVPAAPPVSTPAQAPYARYVSGAGLIEPASQNIAIGTPVSGLVLEVPVQVGARVYQGDELFKLDDRTLKAQLGQQQAALQVAQEQLARLQAMPRAEDVPPVEARVTQQQANLADLQAQLARWEAVANTGAVTKDDVERKRYAVQQAQAALQEAQANLALLRAGAWQQDVAVARGQVAQAQAAVAATQVELERLIVRAPIAGQVLQVNIRVGEFATAGALVQPLLVLGDTAVLHVRADIDENDAWRVAQGAAATAFARGNRDIEARLTFVRFEPLVIPKKSLTGESTERVDTRVLQAIFAIAPGRQGPPLYVGQQMDVYIQSSEPAGGLSVEAGAKTATTATTVQEAH